METEKKGWIWPLVLAAALVAGALIIWGVLERDAGVTPSTAVDDGPRVPAGAEAAAEEPGESAPTGPSPAPEVPLKVRVVGPAGPGPAPGATVRIDGEAACETDADGRCTLDFPLDGLPHDIGAERGESRAEVIRLRDEEDLPADELTLRLGGTGSLEVLVLDPEGTPAKGAALALVPAAADELRTGADGTARFEDLPAGLYKVHAHAGSAGKVQRVWLAAGEAKEIAFFLKPTILFTGVVVDDRRRPLPGLRIKAAPLAREPASSTTDEAGRFALFARTGSVIAEFEGRGYRAQYRGPAVEGLEVVADRLGSLELELQYPDGQPVTGALVSLSCRDPTGLVVRAEVERLPAPGRLRAEGLIAGTWAIYQPARDHRVDAKLAEVTLEPGEAAELTVVLPAGDSTFRGRVLDARDGRPVAGAQVGLGNSARVFGKDSGARARVAVTDAEGRFDFQKASPEQRFVRVDAQGYLPQIVPLPEDEEAAIQLARERRVRGRAVDAKRLPLSWFQLDGKHLRTDGGFFDEPLPNDATGVWVGATGRAEVYREFPEGPEPVELGEVILEQGAPVRIQILEPGGRPAVGAWVVVLHGDRNFGPRNRAGAAPGANREGYTEVRLPPGQYAFLARHPGLVGPGGGKGVVKVVPLEEPLVLQMEQPE